MNSGGACIGCTMPGFPDKFTPFYKASPGSKVSSNTSKLVGSIIRPLRMYTNEHLNREVRWDVEGEVPSGWSAERAEPGTLSKAGHKVYDTIRRHGDAGKDSGGEWGKTKREDS